MKNSTKEKLLKLKPCSAGLSFAESCDFNFAKIWNTCERGDWLIWLLRKSRKIDKPTAVKIAIACAEHVLANFEKNYPNDRRPRKAIEAAIKWGKNPIEENCKAEIEKISGVEFDKFITMMGVVVSEGYFGPLIVSGFEVAQSATGWSASLPTSMRMKYSFQELRKLF